MKFTYLIVFLFLISLNTAAASAPGISGFTPAQASKGARITITGTNFADATAVTFGGTAVIRFTIVSSTTIVAIVDAGSSGNVSVTTPAGTAALQGFTYINAPHIAYNTPQNYGVGIAINPLTPANTGGQVPATVYAQTSTFAGTGNFGSLMDRLQMQLLTAL